MPDRNPTNPTNPTNENSPVRKDERTGSGMEPYRRGRESLGMGFSSPFSFMRRFMSEMDRMFEDFGMASTTYGSSLTPRYGERAIGQNMWSPQIDVFERDGKLIVHADLPGIRQEDVKVNVEDGMLLISGERGHQHEHEKGGVYQCERSFGTFQRRVALPEGVTADHVTAYFENGVLEVSMPMPMQKQTGRTIPIQGKPKGVTH